VDPEIFVNQRQWEKAPAIDPDRLALLRAEEIDLAQARARDRIVRQRLDARPERADETDESAAD
jgi:hypothetical protein